MAFVNDNNNSIQKPLLDRVCILLPTYNNAASLGKVIADSLKQTPHVIVINDGSTDHTADIVSGYPVQCVGYETNKGKGGALQQGFRYAQAQGYDFAVTIDTDGQHYPEDFQTFLNALEKDENVLLIGSRNLNQANVPGKSSFGNKFSTFWFWVETGIKLEDTQSGYRLYPIHQYKDMKFFTQKYEFEIEIIVRSAWHGIKVKHVPISVYYPKPEDRVSHFRPFKDFFRISVLNTILVLIAFLIIKPRDLLIRPIKEKGWQGLKEILLDPSESIGIRSASVGFGVFMGIVPIWGFQLLIGIPLSVLFRMNKMLFIVAANISIFPPVIWAASLATGKWIYGNPHWKIDFQNLTWQEAMRTGKEFFVGGTVLAIVSGLVFFATTYLLLSLRKRS